MKRNWDLVRKILMALEDIQDTTSIMEPGAVTGYDEEIVSYHLQLLIEAGLIDGNCNSLSGKTPLHCRATRLTWEGHEFLDRIRSDTVWNRVKGLARERGLSLNLDVIVIAAKSVIEGMF